MESPRASEEGKEEEEKENFTLHTRKRPTSKAIKHRLWCARTAPGAKIIALFKQDPPQPQEFMNRQGATYPQLLASRGVSDQEALTITQIFQSVDWEGQEGDPTHYILRSERSAPFKLSALQICAEYFD